MDNNITARPAAVAAAMDRAGECYTGDERRVTERRTVPALYSDLLEVARTVAQLSTNYHDGQREEPLHHDQPVVQAARRACVAHGYNPDGTPVPGRTYPVARGLRDQIGQAIADYAAEHMDPGGNVGIDWCSSHDIDPLADKIVALLP
jgi:hypothetical protein